MGNINRGRGEVFGIRVAVSEQGVRLFLNFRVYFRLRHHGVHSEAEGVAKIYAGNQRRRERESQVRLREELRFARVQAQDVVREVSRSVGALGSRMHALYPLQQGVQRFRAAFHARGLQHELGQHLHDVSGERPFLVLRQVVEDVLRLDADEKRGKLRVYHSAAHARRGVGVSNRPFRHVIPRIVNELVHLPHQPAARIRCGQGLAKAKVVCAVQRGQYSGRAIDLLEVCKVVPASQVKASLSMHPAVRLRSCQYNHWLGERRAYLKHGAVLAREVGEERGDVSAASMRVEHQLSQGGDRDFPGEAGAPEQGAREILGYRVRDGAANQVDIGDCLDTRLHLVVELEYEAQDVACLEEADDDDLSGVGNDIVEKHPSDARRDELGRRAVPVADIHAILA